jgi:Skp family chaperone for outer membrane proteins
MRSIAATTIILGALATVASAQGNATGAAGLPEPRVATFDFEKVAAETALGKTYASEVNTLQKSLEAAVSKAQSELEKQDAKIQSLQEALSKGPQTVIDETAQQRQDEIVRLTRDREAFRQDADRDLERLRQKMQRQASEKMIELRKKLAPHVESVVRQRGITLLVERGICVLAAPELDISADVIRKANEAAPASPVAAGPASPSAAKPRPRAAKPPAER